MDPALQWSAGSSLTVFCANSVSLMKMFYAVPIALLYRVYRGLSLQFSIRVTSCCIAKLLSERKVWVVKTPIQWMHLRHRLDYSNNSRGRGLLHNTISLCTIDIFEEEINRSIHWCWIVVEACMCVCVCVCWGGGGGMRGLRRGAGGRVASTYKQIPL